MLFILPSYHSTPSVFEETYTMNFTVLIFQRKQREVAKENEFYIQLLQEALPPELQVSSSSPGMQSSSPLSCGAGLASLLLLTLRHYSCLHATGML